MSENEIAQKLKQDLLNGDVNVDLIHDSESGKVVRYLVTTSDAKNCFLSGDKDEYDVTHYAQHARMVTELMFHRYSGPIAFEVPLSTLIDFIDSYRCMAFELLKSRIALKLHVLMNDELLNYNRNHLLKELSEIVAIGVEIIVDKISTESHIEIATQIWSIIEEVRMDLSSKNAVSYIHLSSLLSSSLMKQPRIGVIIDNPTELPEFSKTYQIATGH